MAAQMILSEDMSSYILKVSKVKVIFSLPKSIDIDKVNSQRLIE